MFRGGVGSGNNICCYMAAFSKFNLAMYHEMASLEMYIFLSSLVLASKMEKFSSKAAVLLKFRTLLTFAL